MSGLRRAPGTVVLGQHLLCLTEQRVLPALTPQSSLGLTDSPVSKCENVQN